MKDEGEAVGLYPSSFILHPSSFKMSVAPTDETLVIETPERVPLHFALASTGNRFLACAFDHFLQILLMAVVFFAVIWWMGFSDLGLWVSSAPNWLLALLIV